MTTSRRAFLIGTSALACTGAPRIGRAQDWPAAPVKVLVPYAAGGNTDGIARLIAQSLSAAFGQSFVVENRTGANGMLAAEAVARAKPDGYTLFMATLPQIGIFPAMTKTTYDPIGDFAPVVNVASNPFLLVANPQFAPKTLVEFIDHVKAQPGKLVYASGGSGSLAHLTMALFLKRAGLDMIHAPYRGGGPAVTDVTAGHVPVYFGNLSEGLPQVQAGGLRGLAVSGLQRVPQLPDVPTVAESGFPGFRTETWNGLMAPANTSRVIVEKIASAAQAALRDQTLLARFADYGVAVVGSGPQEFTETVKTDIAFWADAIKTADVKL